MPPKDSGLNTPQATRYKVQVQLARSMGVAHQPSKTLPPGPRLTRTAQHKTHPTTYPPARWTASTGGPCTRPGGPTPKTKPIGARRRQNPPKEGGKTEGEGAAAGERNSRAEEMAPSSRAPISRLLLPLFPHPRAPQSSSSSPHSPSNPTLAARPSHRRQAPAPPDLPPTRMASDASVPVPAAAQPVPKRRGNYNCGRCGLPKKGHVCPVPGPAAKAGEPPQQPHPQQAPPPPQHQQQPVLPSFR